MQTKRVLNLCVLLAAFAAVSCRHTEAPGDKPSPVTPGPPDAETGETPAALELPADVEAPDDSNESKKAKKSKNSSKRKKAEEAESPEGKGRRRILLASGFLEAGDLAAAREAVDPLVNEPYLTGELGEQILDIMIEIRRRESMREGKLNQDSSRRVALDEVQAGLSLPENYGQTVTISPTATDIELPSGPMEDLVNSNVSMDFKNATVPEIIATLSRIENMNIIADQALLEVPEAAGGGLGAPEPGGGVGGMPTLTVHVTDVPLREVLSYVSRNLGIDFHVGQNVIWVTQAEGNTDNAPELHTRTYKLRRGLIPGPAPSGGGMGSGLGASSGGGDEYSDLDLEDALSYVLVDAEDPFRLFPKRNLLVVRGTLEQLRRVEEILRDFDTRPKQVLIEARFVTISHADLMRLSFDWSTFGVDNPDGEGTTVHSARFDPGVAVGQEQSQSTIFKGLGSTLSLAGVIGELDFNVMMEAMRQTQSFRTLSAPRVTVINNHEAEIKKGYTLRYWEEWEVRDANVQVDADDDGDVTAPDLFSLEPVGSPQSENIGLSLKVKVNIGHDSETVFLSLTPASTQLEGFFNYGTGRDPEELLNGAAADQNEGRSYQLPKITENSLATTVVANSGQTVVLGGMIETREIEQERKVPVLGDIPLLGRLFRSNEDVSEPEHLLVFVTPRIINERGEYVRVSEGGE